jgi:formate hydrogenlyase transcriptional activator
LLRIALPDAAPVSNIGVLSQRSGERERVLEALRISNGRIGGAEGAAAKLGLRRTTLQSRIKKLNIGRQYQ